MDVVLFLEKGIWLGIAAIGFAILFNVPRRALLSIFIIGALGGLTKFLMLEYKIGIVLACALWRFFNWFLSVFAAHRRNCPPLHLQYPL